MADKPRWLRKNDHILSAWAERPAGPGWANTLYWCAVQDGDKKVRVEALQVREMTEGLQRLFNIAAAIQQSIAEELAFIEHGDGKRSR